MASICAKGTFPGDQFGAFGVKRSNKDLLVPRI
jgi:hypothetical protein